MIVFELFYLCFRTSLLSFAGVYGALPELSRLFVTERGWITAHQLTESYMIGQIVPGPNMVLSVTIGYRVAGIPGACAAFPLPGTPDISRCSRTAPAVLQSHWWKRQNAGSRPASISPATAATP